MKLHHIAIWTFRLEELKEFYVRFLGGKSNEKYVNPKKGFESYFISFDQIFNSVYDRQRFSGSRSRQHLTRSFSVHDRFILCLIKSHLIPRFDRCLFCLCSLAEFLDPCTNSFKRFFLSENFHQFCCSARCVLFA